MTAPGTLRMLAASVTAGAGIGAALVWLDRWQFAALMVFIAVAVTCWDLAREIADTATPTGSVEHTAMRVRVQPPAADDDQEWRGSETLAAVWPFTAGAPE